MEEIINNRIATLDIAENLALLDSNPKNMDENMDIILRCIAGKIELMRLKDSLFNS